MLGEPDLLRREGDGYVAIDIKSGAGEESAGEDEDGKLKKHYGVQIALYTDLLDRLGVSAGRYGYIWDVHGEEVRYDLDAALTKDPANTLWALYLGTRLEVGKLLTRETVSTPAAASVCKLCVWRSACLSEVKAADDLTLLPELGRAKRDALRAEFPTVHVLAAANVAGYVKGKKTEFPGIGPETLKRLQARAQLCVTPQAAPYFRERVALPTARQELFFDIETDPLRDLCYLHGFVVRNERDAGSERFVAFFRRGGDSAGRAGCVRGGLGVHPGERGCSGRLLLEVRADGVPGLAGEVPRGLRGGGDRGALRSRAGAIVRSLFRRREEIRVADDGLLGQDAGEVLRIPVAGPGSVRCVVHPVVRRVGEYAGSGDQAAHPRLQRG